MSALACDIRDAIAVLTIDQPDSKVNALGRGLLAELTAAVQSLSGRGDLRGLVVASAKPGVFIAGADLKELADVPGPDHLPTREFIELGAGLLDRLEELPFPTAACIDGAALGGGLEFALACDFRLAGTHPKVRFGLPEVTLGLIPAWGGTQRLPRLIGATSALEMILNNVQLDADQALYRGLVTNVAPSEELVSEALRLLARGGDSWRSLREHKRRAMPIARSGPSLEQIREGNVSDAEWNAMSLSPEAMTVYRQYVDEQMKDLPCRRAAHAALDMIERGCILPLAEALRLERETFLALAGSPEARQLIGAFFQSRKKA